MLLFLYIQQVIYKVDHSETRNRKIYINCRQRPNHRFLSLWSLWTDLEKVERLKYIFFTHFVVQRFYISTLSQCISLKKDLAFHLLDSKSLLENMGLDHKPTFKLKPTFKIRCVHIKNLFCICFSLGMNCWHRSCCHCDILSNTFCTVY